MKPWILFYADGSKITSNEVAPGDSPVFGVVLAVHPKNDRANTVYPGDWLIHHDGQWWGHDQAEMERLAAYRLREVLAFRKGVMVSEDTYEAMCREAVRPQLFQELF